MITINITGRKAVHEATELVTTGSVGMKVHFNFDEAWTGLGKLAVFSGSESIDQLLINDECEIPWEAVTNPGRPLNIGVYGTDADGKIVIPTIYCNCGMIRKGAEPSGKTAQEATPSAVEQMLSAASKADAVYAAYQAGDLDGAPGPAGPAGPQGNSGVYIGADEPTGAGINVWVDTSDDDNTLTDLRQLRFMQSYFIKTNKVYNNYHSGYISTADDVHILAGSRIACKSAAVKYRLNYKYRGDSDYTFVESSDPFEFTADADIRLCCFYADKRMIFNNRVLEEFDVRLKMKELPTKFHRAAMLPDIDCPVFDHSGVEDTSGFNASTVHSDVIAAFDALAAQHPYDLTRRLVVANDVADSQITDAMNPIPTYEFRCGNDPIDPVSKAYTVPTLVLIGSQHGLEKTATYGMYYLLKQMLENPTSCQNIMWLRNRVNIVFVPAVNKFGWDEPLGGRKRYNANGVNLNRNFATYNYDEYPVSEPWTYDCKGTTACDQPETKVMTKIIKRFGYAAAVIDIHSYGAITEEVLQINAFRICPEVAADLPKMVNVLGDYNRHIKPFMDSEYGTDFSVDHYGEFATAPYRPSLSAACPDIIGAPSYLLEVPAGGGILGNDTAKINQLCGEMLAAAIVDILKWHRYCDLL